MIIRLSTEKYSCMHLMKLYSDTCLLEAVQESKGGNYPPIDPVKLKIKSCLRYCSIKS